MNDKKSMPQIRDFYANTEQIAARFGVSSSTIKTWIKKFNLPAFQLERNSSYMIFETDIKKKWIPLIRKYLENKEIEIK